MQTDLSASTSEKKSIQKLQRAIVDGLEDVKAQDIQVFDTEHLSALFERVIVASGNSNRQTRALAASVRDAVRAAGRSLLGHQPTIAAVGPTHGLPPAKRLRHAARAAD